mmetsp:Transcript_11858/g.37837  ORF Transcript_11858/g.37837 Transcript_11858/m.37837 type:complete len:617 (+) Transcript_11858:92-1942(+)
MLNVCQRRRRNATTSPLDRSSSRHAPAHSSRQTIEIILMSTMGLSLLSHLTFSMPCTTSAPTTTRPKTVCLLSSHVVGAVVMKNWEPFVFGPAFAIETVKGRSCRSEAAAVELVLELVPPDGGASRPVAERVPGLAHEAFDDSVEEDAVVVPLPRVRREVLDRLRALVREELDVYLSIRGVDAGEARERPLGVSLGEGEVVGGRLLVEDVAADRVVSLGLEGLARGEEEEAGPLEGAAEQGGVLRLVHLRAAADEVGGEGCPALEEGEVAEALRVFNLAEQPDEGGGLEGDHLDPHDRGEQEELPARVEDHVCGRRLGRRAVLALDRHPPPKVERLEPVRVVAILLQRVKALGGLVVRAARLAGAEGEEAHLEVARADGEVLPVRRDGERERARAGLCDGVEVGLGLELEPRRGGQPERLRRRPVLEDAARVCRDDGAKRRVEAQQQHGGGVDADGMERRALARGGVEQAHLGRVRVRHREQCPAARVRVCAGSRAADPLADTGREVELDPGDHVEGEHVEDLEPAVGRGGGEQRPVGRRGQARERLHVRPKVLDKLDASRHLFPKLELAVAARGGDEVGARHQHVRHPVAVHVRALVHLCRRKACKRAAHRRADA